MNEYEWYGLDNAAKIFPAIRGSHTSSVFRVDVRTKQEIDPKLLEESVNRVLPSFPSFMVRMRKGLFWYYLERNDEQAVVSEEDFYPCAHIDADENSGYLFKVSYFHRKISLDVYHALSDGTGAANFLKAVLCCYFALCSGRKEAVPPRDEPGSPATEDSYSKIRYTAPARKPKRTGAFHLNGTPREKGHVKVIHGVLETDSLIKLVKSKNVTVTAYLASVLAFSILHAASGHLPLRPVKVSIPINLRRFFESETQRNFFTFITVDIDRRKKSYRFEDLLRIVSAQLAEKTTPEYFMPQINYYVQSEKNIFAKATPLFAKNLALRLIHSRSGDETYTCTLSNLGKIDVPPEIQDHVERFDVMMGTSKKNHMNCAVCSCGNQLAISFTLSDYETDAERNFFRFLSAQGLKIILEQNLSE